MELSLYPSSDHWSSHLLLPDNQWQNPKHPRVLSAFLKFPIPCSILLNDSMQKPFKSPSLEMPLESRILIDMQQWYRCGSYLLSFELNPASEVPGLLLEAYSAYSSHTQQCLAGISLCCVWPSLRLGGVVSLNPLWRSMCCWTSCWMVPRELRGQGFCYSSPPSPP